MQRNVEKLGRPIAGYLVQEMIADGVEVFAGIGTRSGFRLSLCVRHGWRSGVEVLRDFALRPVPLREGDAEAMIGENPRAALLGASAAPGGRCRGARPMSLCALGFPRPPTATGSRDRSQSDQGPTERMRSSSMR